MIGSIIALAVPFLNVVVGLSLVPEQLVRVAKAAGCNKGSEVISDWGDQGGSQASGYVKTITESEATSCLLQLWYSSSKDTGLNAGLGDIKEAIYGEVLPQGLNKVFKTVETLGAKIDADDTFVDLGSGAGKSVLQAHLMTPAMRVVGVELSELHHLNAISAREKFVASGAHDQRRKIDFINGDIRKYDEWSDGTVVFFNNLCFDADKLLPFTWDMPRTLQPGSMLIVTKALSGCHPGLIHVQTMTFQTSWSHALPNGKNGATGYLYMVAPSILRPEVQFLVPDEAKISGSSIFLGEAQVQNNPDKLLSPSAFAQMGDQFGLRSSPMRRLGVLVGATTRTAAADEARSDWNNTGSEEVPFRWNDVLATAARAVDHGDSLECVLNDIRAATPFLKFGQEWLKPKPGDLSPPALLGRVLDKVVNVNYVKQGNQETLLHVAAGCGFQRGLSSHALLGGLLELNADVHRKDSLGKTPLHEAAKWTSDPEVMAALVKGGADINAQDNDGRTPLYETLRGADDENPASILISLRADPLLQDKVGRTPMHMAARSGLVGVVELLLSKNAVVDAQDLFGDTPMDYAEAGNHKEVSQVLRQHVTNMKGKDNFDNSTDTIPLASHEFVEVTETDVQKPMSIDKILSNHESEFLERPLLEV